MGQSQSVPSISNGSPSDSKKSLSDSKKRSSNSALSGLDGSEPTVPELLHDLRRGNAQVEHLAIYKEPLKQDQKALSHHQKALSHHFLIIRVADIGKMTPVRYIRAEKHEDTATGKGRISISCDREEFDPADIPEKHGLAMEGCGTISVQKLTDILRAPSPRYSVLTHNCWKYADEAFRLLIKEFSELPETTSEAKQRLQSYLAELRPLELPGHAFNFHWAWVAIAAAAVLSGALVYGYFSSAAAAAATAATVPKLRPVGRLVRGLGNTLPGLPTSSASVKFVGVGSAFVESVGIVDGVLGAVPHVPWTNVINLLTHVWLKLPFKEFGILRGMVLAFCPKVLLIAIGAIGGVAIVLGLFWGLYKILRGIAGNLLPDSDLSIFLDWLDSCFASTHSGFKRS
ncbi:unnamed protein product [Calypogeia fissa]